MSHQVPLSSNPNAHDKYVEYGGLSKEAWQILKQEWGSIAQDLHKLCIFLNFDRDYESAESAFQIPADMKSTAREDGQIKANPKIELAEIRYGQIAGVASQKPSLWFILKHREESKSPISMWSTFSSSVNIYNEYGNLTCKILPDVPVNVVRATLHGSDTYVLLAKHVDPGREWNEAEKIFRDRLGEGERAVVHLEDTKPQGRHRCGIWLAKGE